MSLGLELPSPARKSSGLSPPADPCRLRVHEAYQSLSRPLRPPPAALRAQLCPACHLPPPAGGPCLDAPLSCSRLVGHSLSGRKSLASLLRPCAGHRHLHSHFLSSRRRQTLPASASPASSPLGHPLPCPCTQSSRLPGLVSDRVCCGWPRKLCHGWVLVPGRGFKSPKEPRALPP